MDNAKLEIRSSKDDATAPTKMMQKSYLEVLRLCCSSEVTLIENILKALDGVHEYSVIIPTRSLVVVHDSLLISQPQIVKALNQAGLEANVIRGYDDIDHRNKWPSPYAVTTGVFLLLSFPYHFYHPLRWLALVAVAVGILPIFLKAIASLRSFRIDTNILMLIAVMATIAMNDYIEAGTIVFLFNIAEWLESRASHKFAGTVGIYLLIESSYLGKQANVVMSSLMSIAPQKAIIAETGEEVDAIQVQLNTVLAVKAGEAIPIDGVVVYGTCEVDEQTLTGESFPVSKQMESTVWAGTINLNGYISVRTATLAEDCVVAKMTKLVEEAQNSKSKTQRLIDQCAQYYTPAVVIISASFAVVPFALRFHNLNHWLHFALVVLVSACPCALILSTPVAAFCALTKAAKAGVLIKGGDSLEKLAKIKAMAFDKTGTITTGGFIVTDFQSFNDDIDFNTLLSWVSSIESKSSHPLAAALIDYARSNAIEPKPENVEGFQNFPGEGVQGKIDGKDIYIGNRKIACRAGSGAVPTMEDNTKSGKTVGYVYCGTTHAGIFHLSDRCRTGVAESIKELKLLGIKTVMLTGDNEAAAMYAQEKLEHALEEVHAQLLPEDKGTIIRELRKEGLTAMVGDGINDAPALATADIGISMGISGSALATETGNVILLSNDLRKVPKAIQIAKKAHRKIIENVILSISTKCIILALAFAGHPLVWAAVLADVGTCVLVIFNSMLLLRGTDNHAKNHCNASAAQHPNQHCSKNQPKPCCSIQKVEKVQCDSQETRCASRCQSGHLTGSSCGNNNCMDLAESHAKCVVANTKGFDEAEHCDQGSCKTVIYYDIEANTSLSQCCSGRQNQHTCARQTCERSVETEAICAEGDDLLSPLLASEVSTR